MGEEDSEDYKRGDYLENNSDETYEYVDEEGNIINSSKLDEYDIVEEQPKEQSYEEDSSQNDDKKVTAISEQEYKNNIEKYRPENNATVMSAYTKETPNTQFKEIKPESMLHEKQTGIPTQTTSASNNTQTAKELGTQYFLQQAKSAQEDLQRPKNKIAEKQDSFDNDANEDMLRKLSMSGQKQQSEFLERYAPKEIKEKQKIESGQDIIAEKKDVFDDDKNTLLLKRLTMPSINTQGTVPVKDNSEDSKENPLIYRKGHPHLGTTFGMDTITNLTQRLFNSDKGFEKPVDRKKKGV